MPKPFSGELGSPVQDTVRCPPLAGRRTAAEHLTWRRQAFRASLTAPTASLLTRSLSAQVAALGKGSSASAMWDPLRSHDTLGLFPAVEAFDAWALESKNSRPAACR